MSQAKRHKVARYMRAREQAGIGAGFFDLAEALVAVDRMLATGVREAERLAVELHFAVKLASQPAPDVAGCWGATLPLSPCIRRKRADSSRTLMGLAVDEPSSEHAHDLRTTFGEWRLTRSYPRGEHVQHDPEADLAWPRDDTPLDRRPAWLRGDLKHAEQRRARARARDRARGRAHALSELQREVASAAPNDLLGAAAREARARMFEAMRAQLQRSEAWTTATRGLASCTVELGHDLVTSCTIVLVELQTSDGDRRMGETHIPDRALAHRSTTVAAEAIALVERVADEARRRVQGPGPEQARP